MSTIAENLLALQQVKTNIKTAIEGKGQDLTNVPFTKYAEKINLINTSTPDGKFKVEFKDLDGNYFAPTQYVNAGGSVVLPTGHPELDSEFLEFVEWTASGDLTNVQDNLVCLPVYQTKFNEVANQRPTILKCYFDENTLSPTLQIGSTHTNTYVNWGDGSEAAQVTADTISHTYASAGLYNITIYGDSYNVGGNSTAGVFTDSSYRYALVKAYLGEKVTSIGTNAFQYCYSLTSVTIPSGVTSIGSQAFRLCFSVTNFVIYEDFNLSSLNLGSCALSDESLIDIANKLKDNTGLTTNTITFSIQKHRTRMNTIYLDTNGARVPYGTAGAVSILEFIQNKNWTVSF